MPLSYRTTDPRYGGPMMNTYQAKGAGGGGGLAAPPDPMRMQQQQQPMQLNPIAMRGLLQMLKEYGGPKTAGNVNEPMFQSNPFDFYSAADIGPGSASWAEQFGLGGLGQSNPFVGSASEIGPGSASWAEQFGANLSPSFAQGGSETGGMFSNLLGSGGSGMTAGGAWILPVLAAAVASGVNMFGEGKSPAQTFGTEGWGGAPFAMAENIRDGDINKFLQSFNATGAGLGEGGLLGFIGAKGEGQSTQDALWQFGGPMKNIADWIRGGDTSDFIRMFSFPGGPATKK